MRVLCPKPARFLAYPACRYAVTVACSGSMLSCLLTDDLEDVSQETESTQPATVDDEQPAADDGKMAPGQDAASSSEQGAGGESSIDDAKPFGGTTTVTVPEDAAGPEPAMFQLISDFESGSKAVSGNGLSGWWYSANDCGGEDGACPGEQVFEVMTGGRNGGLAAYTQGGGFEGWGAAVGVIPYVDPATMMRGRFDASEFRGVSFWAKIDPGTPTGMRVRLDTEDADNFQLQIELKEDWTQYKLLWTDFRSFPDTIPLDPSKFLVVQWEFVPKPEG